MNQNPLVSIIIPVYNGADYVGEAINSGLAQTYRPIEIIVINDGSKDDGRTAKVCKSFGDKIRYIEKENGGVSTALNLGIREMKGEYFSWLSHDDRYLPNKIAANIEFINKYSSSKIIPFTNYRYIDPKGILIKKTTVKENGFNSSLYSLLMGNINGLSVLVHRDCLQAVGGFDESLRTIQDYACFFELAKRYQFVYDKRFLVETRIHPLQQGTIRQKEHLNQSDQFFVSCIERTRDDEIAPSKRLQAKAWYRIAYRYRRNGYQAAETLAVKRAKQIESKNIETILDGIIYRSKVTLLYPFWLVLARMYRRIRNI